MQIKPPEQEYNWTGSSHQEWDPESSDQELSPGSPETRIGAQTFKTRIEPSSFYRKIEPRTLDCLNIIRDGEYEVDPRFAAGVQ